MSGGLHSHGRDEVVAAQGGTGSGAPIAGIEGIASIEDRIAGSGVRVQSIDVLRGLAIVAVIGLHMSWTMLEPLALLHAETWPVILLHLACIVGAPMFLAMSAAAMSLRYREPFGGWAAYLDFVRRRALRLLPAYVVWSIVTAIYTDPALVARPGRVVSLLVNGSADAQLYFVPMLFELYVLWPLLRPLAQRARQPMGAAIVVAIGLAVSMAGWAAHLQRTGTPFILFFVFVCAGMGLAPMLASERRRAGAALAGAAAAAMALAAFHQRFFAMIAGDPTYEAARWASTIFQLPATAYILLFIGAAAAAAPYTIGTAAGSVMATLGRSSYGVFLCHLMLARLLVFPFLDTIAGTFSPIAGVVVVSTVVLVISYAFTRLLTLSARTAWIVGE